MASLENHSTRVLHLSSFLMKKPKSKLLLNLTVKVNAEKLLLILLLTPEFQKKGQLKKMLMMKKMLKQIAMVTKTIKLNKTYNH